MLLSHISGIFLRLYGVTYMRTCCSLHPPADAAHVTHDGDEDDDGGGDTGWEPIGCRSRASLFIQWNADPLKVPTQLHQRPLCVCVCFCEGPFHVKSERGDGGIRLASGRGRG